MTNPTFSQSECMPYITYVGGILDGLRQPGPCHSRSAHCFFSELDPHGWPEKRLHNYRKRQVAICVGDVKLIFPIMLYENTPLGTAKREIRKRARHLLLNQA